MNKKAWIGGIVAVALVGGAGGAIAAESAGYIGKEKAKAIALKQVPGTVEDVDFERERGKSFYEVEIRKANGAGEADLDIDAVSGAVLRVDHDNGWDDDDDYNAAAASSAPTTATTTTTTAASGTATSAAASGTTASAAISEEKARSIALAQVAGKVVKVESELDDGILEYEVKIQTATGYAEVDINAKDGSVRSIDHDRYDDDDDDDRYDDDDDRYDDDRYDD
ncbi:putative membrane protein YkoI [Paenibacillus phyllosphaerae]|uniref:Putative membrane protein YkoI n=1 Tax=Paenibacillus phyllosphaerae TaxID=274593 RepID=A0A7W5FNL5_9BACL|nr:PepSY domain-containing protein [Paenibacillus phyllosphaerae]MBB3111313.1 putative membrane protein YkoI [Paenibacillus phyllosphaerae]